MVPFSEFQKSDMILVIQFIMIIGLYMVLMISDTIPLWGAILLGVLWVIYLIIKKHLVFSSPVDIFTLLLLISGPISLLVSVDWRMTLPKVYGLCLGVALCHLLINLVRSKKQLYLALIALSILSLGIIILGILGSDWSGSRFAFLNLIYDRLPHMVDFLPRSPDDRGISGNSIGGALTFLAPLLASIVWNFTSKKRDQNYLNFMGSFQMIFIPVSIILLILIGATLFITQSRGAILGSLVGIFALVIWKDHRFLWAIPIAMIAFVILFNILGNGNLAELISVLDTSEDPTLPTRVEIWKGSLYMIQDLPITGGGLGTYQHYFSEFYSPQNKLAFHAHNVILTIASDQGLPVLILYVGLLSSVGSLAWKIYKTSKIFIQTIVMGLACGLLAYHVFGLTDSFILGSKLGIVLWIFIGLIVSVYVNNIHLEAGPGQSFLGQKDQVLSSGPFHHKKRLLKDYSTIILLWMVISLVSVTFINLSPIISLLIAVLGGTILGIRSINRFLSGSTGLELGSNKVKNV